MMHKNQARISIKGAQARGTKELLKIILNLKKNNHENTEREERI